MPNTCDTVVDGRLPDPGERVVVTRAGDRDNGAKGSVIGGLTNRLFRIRLDNQTESRYLFRNEFEIIAKEDHGL